VGGGSSIRDRWCHGCRCHVWRGRGGGCRCRKRCRRCRRCWWCGFPGHRGLDTILGTRCRQTVLGSRSLQTILETGRLRCYWPCWSFRNRRCAWPLGGWRFNKRRDTPRLEHGVELRHRRSQFLVLRRLELLGKLGGGCSFGRHARCCGISHFPKFPTRECVLFRVVLRCACRLGTCRWHLFGCDYDWGGGNRGRVARLARSLGADGGVIIQVLAACRGRSPGGWLRRGEGGSARLG